MHLGLRLYLGFGLEDVGFHLTVSGSANLIGLHAHTPALPTASQQEQADMPTKRAGLIVGLRKDLKTCRFQREEAVLGFGYPTYSGLGFRV